MGREQLGGFPLRAEASLLFRDMTSEDKQRDIFVYTGPAVCVFVYVFVRLDSCYKCFFTDGVYGFTYTRDICHLPSMNIIYFYINVYIYIYIYLACIMSIHLHSFLVNTPDIRIHFRMCVCVCVYIYIHVCVCA